MTTLGDLINARKPAEIRTALLAKLAELGFPVTSWESGGVARTLVEGISYLVSDVETAIAAIAMGGLLDQASGKWLTLLAKSAFGIDRQLATFATGLVTFTETAGTGPHSLSAGQMIVGRNASGSSEARRFIAVDGGTLNPNGTATVHVKAERPGAAYNLGASQITYLFTPLPGVVVTNGSTWLSQSGCAPGVDEETDERLRQRCRDRWATLGRGATRAAYRYWITTASAEATKVYFSAPPGDGSVPVWIAGDDAPVSGGALSTVQAAVAAEAPITDTPQIANATAVPLAVLGTVYVPASYFTAAQAAADDARIAYQKRLSIGQSVDLGALYQILRAHPAVSDVDITSPAADTAVTVPGLAVIDLASVVWSAT